MSLKERIVQIEEKKALERRQKKEEEQAQKEARQNEYVQTLEERNERAALELDRAILHQRVLFNELKDMGVIDMLNEQVTPGEIDPPFTRKELEERQIEFKKDYQNNVKRNIDRIRKQSWKGTVSDPTPNNVGVVINIHGGDRYMFHENHWSEVQIEYTEDRNLIIRGEKLEFRRWMDGTPFDNDKIEESLERAFVNPMRKSASEFASPC